MSETDDMRAARTAALLQEHDELVQLFVHEDGRAFQVNVALLAAEGGLLAGAQSFGIFDVQRSISMPLVIVLLGGALLNVVGFFVLQKVQLLRMSRLYRGFRIEAELALLDVTIRTFDSVEGNISRRTALNPPSDKDETRRLRWWENVEPLNLRLVFNLLAGVFLFLAIWALIGRPGLS